MSAVFLTACLSGLTFAASVPAGFHDSVFADNIPRGTAMAFAPDGRLFVCQQDGAVRVVKNGVLLPTPFATVITDTPGERGLLGIAFDPAFLSTGFVYVYYTATTPTFHNRISRFQADAGNPDVAIAGSEKAIVDLDNLVTIGHIGGAIAFGLDGKLYAAVGDNDAPGNSPALISTKGKMLRFNADGTIPADNPLISSTKDQNQAIWALGLRNPYTFAIHRDTGRMFINDVGANEKEEINDGIAGANYGWPSSEGATTDPRFRTPIFSYGHGESESTGCAITGGAWYDSSVKTFPAEFHNKYFYADFCSGWIRTLDPDTGATAAFASGNASTIGLLTGPDGALYYYDRGIGSVGRIQFNSSGQAPVIGTQPRDQILSAGQPAIFQIVATGTPPLNYQWRRNDENIPTAVGETLTLPVVAAGDNGARFSCAVSNAFGTSLSRSASFKAAGKNKAPKAKITAPRRTPFIAGGSYEFGGSGFDLEDGDLPASAFEWKIDFHHDKHVHPFMAAMNGAKSGTFSPSVDLETATRVWYRITLPVTDSGGASSTVFSDLKPKLVKLSVLSTPPGAALTLDGQPVAKALKVTTVAGVKRTLGVVSPQIIGGQKYVFESWSDGGGAEHDVNPLINTALTVKLKLAE